MKIIIEVNRRLAETIARAERIYEHSNWFWGLKGEEVQP